MNFKLAIIISFIPISLSLFSCKKHGTDPIVVPDANPPLANMAGQTYTLAGGEQGAADGIRLYAKFNNPNEIAIDATGNLFVVDQSNNKIRKISPDGTVTTFAGSGTLGKANGEGTAASFNDPIGITIDASANLFVTDFGNNIIRKIDKNGVVTTVAGTGEIGFNNGTAATATFNGPTGIVADKNGNLFVSDNHNVIRKISSSGEVSTFAGKILNTAPGYADGTGADANFNIPGGLAIDAAGNIYVADVGDNMIRKVTPSAVVTTIAGQLSAGSQNERGPLATFNQPAAVAVDGAGNIYVTDDGNNLIRKISTSGYVTTVAGTGAAGSSNGSNLSATFAGIRGIAVDAAGNLYIADSYSKIRKVIQVK